MIVEVPIPMPTWNAILAMHPHVRKKVRHLVHLFVRLAIDDQPPREIELAEYFATIRKSGKNNAARNRLRAQLPKPLRYPREVPERQREGSMFTEAVDLKFTHYRQRLIDPDGMSVKAFIDGLVTAAVLPDDNHLYIRSISHEQVKEREERTVCEIKKHTAGPTV